MGSASRGIRNVYRSKGKAAIVIIILGLTIGIFVTMTQAGTSAQGITNLLKGQFANLIVVRATGSTEMGLGFEMLKEEFYEPVNDIPNIVKVEKYIYWRVIEEDKDPPLMVYVGVLPGDEVRLATHGSVGSPETILGRAIQDGDQGKNVAYVGRYYAEKRLGLDVEQLLNTKPDNIGSFTLEGREFKIVGLFTSGFQFGDSQVVIPYKVAQETFNLQGRTTILYITADGAENTQKIAQQVKERLGEKVDVIAGTKRIRLILDSLGSIESTSTAGSFLATAVSILVIGSVMILITKERTKEIGVLKAIGASNSDVIKQFVIESIVLAAIGGAIGFTVFTTIGPALAAQVLGLQYGEQLGAHLETPISGLTINLGPSLQSIALGIGVILAIGALSSIYPAYKAAKMDAADALRAK